MLTRWLVPLACGMMFLAGCGDRAQSSDSIREQIKQLIYTQTETIDLATVGSDDWSNLCVIQPYSDNETVSRALGFDWNAEDKTSVRYSDSTVLLLFATDREVVDYVEYPRYDGDFARQEPPCLDRERAEFTKIDKEGWVRLETVA